MKRVLALMASAVAALAQQAAPVTLDQAVQEAVEHNLNLIAERYNVSVADARIIQARLRPNPVLTLGLDYQDVFHRGFTLENGAGPPEGTSRVDFPVERGHKREYRVELAQSLKSVAELNLLNTIRQLRLDVQNAFVDVQIAKDRLALAQENLRSLQGIVDINTTRVRAGDLAEVELMRSRVALLQFNASVQQAELALRTARNRLRLFMGRTGLEPAFDVAGTIREDRQDIAIDNIRTTAMTVRPDLLAMRRDQARSVADIRLQIAMGKVDYSVGAQYHHQYGPVLCCGQSMGFFLQMPISVFNRNQGEIERARRENEQLGKRVTSLEAQINNEVQTAYDQYQTSRTLVENIEATMLKQAREVRDITEYSYRRGEASLVEFLDAQRAFNDTMQTYNEARGEYARNLYLLESVSGKGVNP
jgi:cobalt-zinc-cadmium efflux system outer membrane protein